MTNIPEPTLVQIRRFLARDMPLEEIAFLTRIEPEVIEEEIRQCDEELGAIPEEHLAMIRKLGRENMPVGRIAFMTHMSQSTVHEVLAIAGIEPTPNPPEEGSSR
jgi:predicted DNA-binding protein YlxM (UPF0122 family)